MKVYVIEHNMGWDGVHYSFVTLGNYTEEDLRLVIDGLNNDAYHNDEYRIMAIAENVEWEDGSEALTFPEWCMPGYFLDVDEQDVWSLNKTAKSLPQETVEKLKSDWKVLYSEEPSRLEYVDRLDELFALRTPKTYVH